MKTKAQLSTKTLQMLRVVGADDTPSAADAAFVEDAYDTKAAEWKDRGLVYWANTNRNTAEIPDAVFDALVDLMQNHVGSSFGQTRTEVERMAVEESLLLRLRRHLAKPSAGENTKFMSY